MRVEDERLNYVENKNIILKKNIFFCNYMIKSKIIFFMETKYK